MLFEEVDGTLLVGWTSQLLALESGLAYIWRLVEDVRYFTVDLFLTLNDIPNLEVIVFVLKYDLLGRILTLAHIFLLFPRPKFSLLLQKQQP